MQRQNSIGGSEAAAVVGLSKWKTPMEIYLEKTMQAMPRVQTAALLIGTKFERDVLQFLAEESKIEVEGRFSQKEFHPDIPFMSCQVDGIVKGENAIVECKITTSIFSDLVSKVPDDYMIQCQHNMAVHGADRCYLPFFVLDPREEVKRGIHIVERDEEMIKYLIDIESHFWNNHVVPQIPPNIDFEHFLTAGLLGKMFPNSIDKEVALSEEEYASYFQRLHELKDAISGLEHEQEAIKNSIKHAMADASIAKCGAYTATWKSSETTRLDTKRIKSESPDIYEKYSTKSTSRTFLLKGTKND